MKEKEKCTDQKVSLIQEVDESFDSTMSHEERKKYLMVGNVPVKIGSTIEELHEIIAAL